MPPDPRLAGTGWGVSALSFLTAQALEAKRKEEEEEQEAKRRKTHAAGETARLDFRSLLAVPRSRRTAEHKSRLNAVTQLLGAASKRRRSDVFLVFLLLVADVPVIMQLLFQQSKVYANMTVSHIQFIGRVLDIPVMPQRQVRTVLTCADCWRLEKGW